MMRSSLALLTLCFVPLMAEPTQEDCTCCCYEYGVNPPVTGDGCGFYASGSYLYWKACQDHNCWGVEIIPADGDPTNLEDLASRFKGKTVPRDVNYQWDSGFEAALGYNLPCDMWSIVAKWTYYETNAHRIVHVNPGYVDPAFLIGVGHVLAPEFLVAASGEGEGRWRLCFNQIDLDFRRDFYVGCFLSITPYAGLRGQCFEQKYHIETSFAASTDDSGLVVNTEADYLSKMKCDFKSIGLKGGLGAFYEVACGLGIYGDVGLSLVYGCYDIVHNLDVEETIEIVGGSTTENEGFNHVTSKFETLRPNLDLAIGVMWRYSFNCDRSNFFAKVGWEHHCYFYQNGFLAIEQISGDDLLPHPRKSCGNLYLYGLVASVGVNF